MQERRLQGVWGYGLGSVTMLTAAMLVTLLALNTQLQPEPWYHPRYAIPLLGMILGNTMTGVSLGLNVLTTNAHRERAVFGGVYRLSDGRHRLRLDRLAGKQDT